MNFAIKAIDTREIGFRAEQCLYKLLRIAERPEILLFIQWVLSLGKQHSDLGTRKIKQLPPAACSRESFFVGVCDYPFKARIMLASAERMMAIVTPMLNRRAASCPPYSSRALDNKAKLFIREYSVQWLSVNNRIISS